MHYCGVLEAGPSNVARALFQDQDVTKCADGKLPEDSIYDSDEDEFYVPTTKHNISLCTTVEIKHKEDLGANDDNLRDESVADVEEADDESLGGEEIAALFGDGNEGGSDSDEGYGAAELHEHAHSDHDHGLEGGASERGDGDLNA